MRAADRRLVGAAGLRHAVVIASTRRPQIVGETLRSLLRQTRQADVVVLSVASANDVPADLADGVRVVHGPAGLTRQRNAGLDALPADVGLVTYLDDDAEPALDYLERARAFATARPDVVLFDGAVLRDGALTGEIDREDARLTLARHTPRHVVRTGTDAYGCNMNVRREVAARVRFDERLPRYGWLEDRDFSVRCSRLGTVARYEGCAIVHLGTRSGRVSGRSLGRAQVVNPHYLWRKGVLTPGQAIGFWTRAFGGNLHGVLVGDSSVDRRGRLRGNATGLLAVLRGEDPAEPAAVVGVDPFTVTSRDVTVAPA